jgi:hypothetical protein
MKHTSPFVISEFTNSSGGIVFQLYARLDGKRFRKNFPTREEAEAERQVAKDDVKAATPFLVHHFREIDFEVEGFLAVGQLVDEIVNLPFEFFLLLSVGGVEVARFEFFQPQELFFFLIIGEVYTGSKETLVLNYFPIF